MEASKMIKVSSAPVYS